MTITLAKRLIETNRKRHNRDRNKDELFFSGWFDQVQVQDALKKIDKNLPLDPDKEHLQAGLRRMIQRLLDKHAPQPPEAGEP